MLKHLLSDHPYQVSTLQTEDFGALSSEVSRLLTYKAAKDLETETKIIEGRTWPS